MIKVEIVADSVAPSAVRLTTFVLTYPRFIHAELMTHRVLSRNASSSRAIPVKKSIQMVRDNPAIPLAFTKNQKGMQGGQALDGEEHEKAVAAWLEGRDRAVEVAEKLSDLEVHKQYANRVLEPWAHISVVCSATEWANFFALRYHPAAQPEFCELAKQMWEAYGASNPEYLQDGDWHLPFITAEEKFLHYGHVSSTPGPNPYKQAIKMSVARCARVSYLTHEGKAPNIEEDFALYERLLGSNPIHASPAEHQAQASQNPFLVSGNFHGWQQYRKTLEGENVTVFEGPK